MQFALTQKDLTAESVALARRCRSYADFYTRHRPHYDWLRSNGKIDTVAALLGRTCGRRKLTPEERAASNVRKGQRLKAWKSRPNNRLIQSIRVRTNHALRGRIKFGRSVVLLGCSVSKLRQHLESQFKPGMSWANYGAWHVDHIRPCASFDLSTPEEQRTCFHYTNLQPLWALENLSKNSKICS